MKEDNPHPWALPIVKHQANHIMNLNIVDHQAEEEGSVDLLLNSERDLMPISRHNISHTSEVRLRAILFHKRYI
jgi:hypothetical protein